MKLLHDHVVVLMMENRAFDHLFGHLGVGEGLSKVKAVNYLKPGDKSSTAFPARRGGDFVAIGQGPAHSLKEVNEQLFGSTHVAADAGADTALMNGFVASFAIALRNDLKRTPTTSELQQVMNCFDPVQLPVLSTLARSFVLCDHWFADVPGPTMPNRAYVHAATSQGYTWNANWKPVFTCPTLYDRINAKKGLSWRVYYHDQNDVLELYPKLKKTVDNNALFENTFLSDVAADRLATYSFVIPAFLGSHQQPVNSMHAPADVRPAEKLVADVYSTLRSHPDVFRKTLFIVVFDEHGGYYDHVRPPATVSPDGIPGRTDQSFLVPFAFNRLGVRVPAILISPWLAPAVDSTVYSHASIPGTIIESFQLPGSFLTKRDGGAAKLTKYLVDDGKRKLRTNTPDLTVPVQPQPLDAIQRDVLAGSVHLDPHPEFRSELRTRDIQSPEIARQFMRTQVSKHLEHYFAAGGRPDLAAKMRAPGQLPAPAVSAARIAALQSSRTPARPAAAKRGAR